MCEGGKLVLVPYSSAPGWDPGDVQANIDRALSDSHCTAIHLHRCEVPVLYDHGIAASPDALVRSFLASIETADRYLSSPGVVWCHGGGTGAARVVNRIRKPRSPREPRGHLAVIGGSDNCLYPLTAWLLLGVNGYFGPGIDTPGFSVIRALDTIMANFAMDLENASLLSSSFGGLVRSAQPWDKPIRELELSIVPATITPLTSLWGPVRTELLRYLSTNKCLLLLEDTFAGDSGESWIALYEELTRLEPYLMALHKGGGVCVFAKADIGDTGPSPLSIIARSIPAGLPTFYGLSFGHGDHFQTTVRYGSSVALSYDSDSGVLDILSSSLYGSQDGENTGEEE